MEHILEITILNVEINNKNSSARSSNNIRQKYLFENPAGKNLKQKGLVEELQLFHHRQGEEARAPIKSNHLYVLFHFS